MVEPTNGFKTKYGSIWPTVEEAEAQEIKEAAERFKEDYIKMCYPHRAMNTAFEDEQEKRAAKFIYEHIYTILYLIEKYGFNDPEKVGMEKSSLINL